ncbi:MAG TPA: O-antigen ligase family protein, partial [Candidatus Limnocylindria bacterium]
MLSDLPAAILVGIALVLGSGAFVGARALGERLSWVPAGGIILIALTPLVPRVQIGLGFSLDDVLPIVGLAMLIPAARFPAPSMEALRSRPVIGAIAIGLACLVVAGLLSALLNGDEPTRFVRFLARSSGRFLFLAAIAIVLARVISQRPGASTLAARALAVMGTVEAVFGLVAFVLPLPDSIGLARTRPKSVLFEEVPGRISGTLGLSPNFTGAVLMVTAIITIALAVRASGRTARIGLVVAALVQLIALALTFSRAPLALGVAGIVALLVLTSRPVLLAPIAGVIGVVALFTPLLARFVSDVTDRLALWYSATLMMLDHPLGGVGPGQMVNVMREIPERYMETPVGRAVSNAHNTILLAGAELGVLAAIGALIVNAGLLVVGLAVIRNARGRADITSTLRIGGAVALICLLVQGMVNNLFTVGVTSVMVAFVVGAFVLAAPP